MRKEKTILHYNNTILPLIFSFLGAIVALYPSNPNNMSLPSRDSGVFLYIGWRMLKGETPYLQIWDHKPPLIYFVDALGIWLTPNSFWGIWLIQLIFISATVFLTYKSIERTLGSLSAAASSILMVSSLLTITKEGNVTEEYALLFQVICIWLIVLSTKRGLQAKDILLIGLAGGIAFNFKQTTIGMLISYGAVLLAKHISERNYRLALKNGLILTIGWLIPSVALAMYFASKNALWDFWEQAYLYNFSYIQKGDGIQRIIPALIKGNYYLSKGGLLYLAILGWVTGVVYLLTKRKSIFQDVDPLIVIALLGLPVEAGLILTSGRSIVHYYLTPIPILVVLAGVLIFTILYFLKKRFGHFSKIRTLHTASAFLLIIVVLLAQVPQVKKYPQYIAENQPNQYKPVIDYIENNTTEGDFVLIMGAESTINFITRRPSPTKFVYQYPLQLLMARPTVKEYLRQIMENEPKLIIDTQSDKGFTGKLYLTKNAKKSEPIQNGVDFLNENYQPVTTFGDWIVYEYQGKP